ncbi:PEP/pyruvate-binding domain-containing protein [Pseudarthrobacter sp. DSP2-3-2b1]|uniref:PEP/pyruvate-binding domain-containing protein n=1 Tax=Pseudarthrobacter sp. DSP2-3-2b1 TaxID=2804661 RepID=UPI003CF135D7
MSDDVPFPRLGVAAAQSREVAGSKAAALSALSAAGFPVPAGFVVTQAAMQEQSADRTLAEHLRKAASTAGPGPFAVRSSAAAEDLPDASFAGMYESYLRVETEDLPAAVERCFGSANTDRVRAYEASVAALSSPAMAVLVQQMVEPVAAGVAFTANPLTGVRDEIIISAVPGLGEKLVSGVSTGEEWTVRHGRPHRTPGKGTVLMEQSATAVAALAARVAVHFGCPQDIEWAMDGTGNVLILQARPMTALPEPVSWEPPGKGPWLRNFRLGEWLSEPVTPLFMDWAIPRIDAAYNNAVRRSVGIEVPMRNGVINGWYYVSPPSPRNLPHVLFGGPPRSVPFFYNSVFRPMFDPAGADRTVLRDLEEEWRSDCLPAYLALAATPSDALGSAAGTELISLVDQVTGKAGEYLWFFSATGGGAWKMEMALARFWRRHLARPLAGTAPPSSAQPEQTLGYQTLLGGLAPVLPAAVPHAVYSLDWYFPTAGEGTGGQPGRGIGQEAVPPAGTAVERRRQAEAQCRAVLKGTRQLHRFDALLSLAQHYAVLREEQVRYFTLGWPLLRRCTAELGARLRDRGLIDAPEDIYFLTYDALGMDTPKQQENVERRRREWMQQRKLTAPLTAGKLPPLVGNAFDRLANLARTSQDHPEGALVGHPASPGRAQGRVRVVDGPEDFADFEPGEVLVAKATAPAWTPLFAYAAAVVTDGGNLAAHASLVAREYGIPAVVGTGKATRILHTGQLVTVDGNAGTVVIHEG